MGPYKGYIRAILGKPFRGTTLGVQPRNPRLEGFRVQLCGGIGSAMLVCPKMH